MTIVVGTAGHIDHGKTSLLRALTGIDADRLPEERRRGMTIDVGFAHLDLSDGTAIDFVDVPGHDRLVANMLVGAGEIDAALLVVAVDEGVQAQTLEHLDLLDGLGIGHGLVVVTKADRVTSDDPLRRQRVREVETLLEGTSLARSPVVLASAETGEGLEAVRAALQELSQSLAERPGADGPGPVRLGVDRVFSVPGRGTVATGTLRGGPLAPGTILRILPGPGEARVREVQVHGRRTTAALSGRTAVNLAGVDLDEIHRGVVLTTDAAVEPTERLLVRLRPPRGNGRRPGRGRPTGPRPVPTAIEIDDLPGPLATAGEPSAGDAANGSLRLHLGTAQVGARMGRGARTRVHLPDGQSVAEVRLESPVAAAPGDAFVLRRPSPGELVAGGVVLDPRPPIGPSRRRSTPERLAALGSAGDTRQAAAALLELHGALTSTRWRALGGEGGSAAGSLVLAGDVLDGLAAGALAHVGAHHDADPTSAGVPLAVLRTALALDLRRRVAASPPDASAAATAILEGLVAGGRLARDGETIRDPARGTALPPALTAAMDRLERLLTVAAPPAFADAVAASACPPEGVRRLELAGRIVRLDPHLAYATTTYRGLAARALELARSAPLTPATFRDSTGTSRRYVLAILEDLDRRGVLSRSPAGHVPGPRADIPGALP